MLSFRSRPRLFEYCDSSSTGPPQTNKLKDPVTRHSPSRKASWYTRDTAGTKLMRKYDALSVVRTVRNYTSFIIYYQKPIRDWNVLLICLLCPMLANGIHFQKYHIWNKKKRELTNQTSQTTWRSFTSCSRFRLKKMADKRGKNSRKPRKLSKIGPMYLTERLSRILLPHHPGQT